MSYSQCFICREWSWDVSNVQRVPLCIPCYVDVLEVRQARGDVGKAERSAQQPRGRPGKSVPAPSPYVQTDLFRAESFGLAISRPCPCGDMTSDDCAGECGRSRRDAHP